MTHFLSGSQACDNRSVSLWGNQRETQKLKTDYPISADDRHDRTKQKPNADRHVLSRFAILGAVTKRARARMLRGEQDRHRQDRQKLFHVMIRSRFIFR